MTSLTDWGFGVGLLCYLCNVTTLFVPTLNIRWQLKLIMISKNIL